MNKKIYYIFLGMVVFLIVNVLNVNSTLVCEYGTRENDNPSTWSSKIKFEIKSWDDVEINLPESPMISKYNDPFEKVSGELFQYKGKSTKGTNESIQIYLSFYSNETMFNQYYDNCKKSLNNASSLSDSEIKNQCGCPSTVKYKKMREAGAIWNLYHLVIFNDELDEKEIENRFWKNLMEDETEEGYLIEKRKKEESIDDLVDDYSCTTYSVFLQGLKETVNNGNKSCDNNVEFDKLYVELEQSCESFRATSTYAKDDGAAIRAKACSKACSSLYDDVAEMCKINHDSGYCGSLGNKVVNWIFKILRMIRYGLPAILIILSILDFIRALASEDEGEMKKVTGRFAKRLIALALVFIIPFILDFILKMFDIPGLNASNPFCAW